MKEISMFFVAVDQKALKIDDDTFAKTVLLSLGRPKKLMVISDSPGQWDTKEVLYSVGAGVVVIKLEYAHREHYMSGELKVVGNVISPESVTVYERIGIKQIEINVLKKPYNYKNLQGKMEALLAEKFNMQRRR